MLVIVEAIRRTSRMQSVCPFMICFDFLINSSKNKFKKCLRLSDRLGSKIHIFLDAGKTIMTVNVRKTKNSAYFQAVIMNVFIAGF